MIWVVARPGSATGRMTRTVVGIAVLWVAVYGSGLVLSFLPYLLYATDSDFKSPPSPTWVLHVLPNVLHGQFSWHTVGRLAGFDADECDLVAGGRALLGNLVADALEPRRCSGGNPTGGTLWR